jgi:electron-transferring-flavoprotein dehydrogenase
MQWVGTDILGSGLVTIWPGTPVGSPILEENQVKGIRLVDQGVDKEGRPTGSYMPGMDVRALLTVVGDGPVGAVGQQLDEHFGLPEGHHQSEWAVGAKMVIDLREEVRLKPGIIYHTIGFPEPEIFGFLYAHSERTVSVGIFVPSWFKNPVKTSYRYLQHWMMHPYFWKYLEGGTLRSWGAKSLQESGKRGEPFLVGDGYARIGEGSGSTNILTGSGVDEAWMTGKQLAESVIALLEDGKPFTKEDLEDSYVKLRRSSWVEKENQIAEKSRDGFARGFIRGILGMALAGFSKGKLGIPVSSRRVRTPTAEEYYRGRISSEEIKKIREECREKGLPAHDILLDRAGWPRIPFDGKLLVSQQDALLIGGKVQAAPGFADHVTFLHPEFCEDCGDKVCVEICSGQAIERDPLGGVRFDREKCVHCGACFWSCTGRDKNIQLRAGSGGLHSAEN